MTPLARGYFAFIVLFACVYAATVVDFQDLWGMLLFLAFFPLAGVGVVLALVSLAKRRFFDVAWFSVALVLPIAVWANHDTLVLWAAHHLVNQVGADALRAEAEKMMAEHRAHPEPPRPYDKKPNTRLDGRTLDKNVYPAWAGLHPIYLEVADDMVEAKKSGMGDWAGIRVGTPDWCKHITLADSPKGVVKLSDRIYWMDQANPNLPSQL